jgi:DASH complex subunit DAM1
VHYQTAPGKGQEAKRQRERLPHRDILRIGITPPDLVSIPRPLCIITTTTSASIYIMSSATPQPGGSTKRSTSGSRRPISRPTTPLRPSSRSSLRESSALPLDAFEPAFAELSDSMADLEANFMHLQLMHESLARFSENFASFLYGLNMNAFCVDFPEV